MKCLLLLAGLVAVNGLFAQTGLYIEIPGTKCSMIPPKDFTAATNFSGFQHTASGASIMVTELPAPVQTLVDGFTADALATRGMVLLSKQTITLGNTQPATIMHVKQPANGMIYFKWMLVFGDSSHTVLVNGIYPEAAAAIAPAIKKAVLTTVYNSRQEDKPLATVNFSIDVSGSGLQLAKYITGSLIYTADGKIPSTGTTLIVSSSIAKYTGSNREQFAVQRLQQLAHNGTAVIKENNPVTINGLSGYEIVADSKDKDGQNEMMYQVILYTANNDYFIILGLAKDAQPGHLASFRKIAGSFKQR
jgi:hypothetical protein